MYETITMVMQINRMLNNFYINALSMMNPPSISTIHTIHQNVLLHKRLTKVFLIKASTTRAQDFNILTELFLNEAHELSDTVNVFRGKQSAVNPTSIHLVNPCRQTQINKYKPIRRHTFRNIKNKNSDIYLAAL